MADGPLHELVATATAGHGADVVLDVVGGPLFEPCLKCLAHRGRQVAIASTGDMKVSFDLVDFYYREGRLFGVDTPLKQAVRGGAPGKALEITGWSAVTAAVTADRSAD
jgi:NADPH:quinone reductase